MRRLSQTPWRIGSQSTLKNFEETSNLQGEVRGFEDLRFRPTVETNDRDTSAERWRDLDDLRPEFLVVGGCIEECIDVSVFRGQSIDDVMNVVSFGFCALTAEKSEREPIAWKRIQLTGDHIRIDKDRSTHRMLKNRSEMCWKCFTCWFIYTENKGVDLTLGKEWREMFIRTFRMMGGIIGLKEIFIVFCLFFVIVVDIHRVSRVL